MFRKVIQLAEIENPQPPPPKPSTVKMVVGPGPKKVTAKTPIPVKISQVKKVEKRDLPADSNGDVPTAKKPKEASEPESGETTEETTEGLEMNVEEEDEESAPPPASKGRGRPKGSTKVKVSSSE